MLTFETTKTMNSVIRLLIAGVIAAQTANATTITFDDLPFPTSSRPWNWSGYGTGDLPYGGGPYAGFIWNSVIGYQGPSGSRGAAYFHRTGEPHFVGGIVSGDQAAFTAWGYPIVMNYIDGPTFTFNSVYLTTPYYSPEPIRVTGYREGVEIYRTDVSVLSTAAKYTFNYVNIDTLKFDPLGGPHLLLDDLVINESIVLNANVELAPETLNLGRMGRWITAYVSLPAGFELEAINVATLRIASLSSSTWSDETLQNADTAFTPVIEDANEDGALELTVKFSGEALKQRLITGNVSVVVEFDLNSGEKFRGSDTINVIQE